MHPAPRLPFSNAAIIRDFQPCETGYFNRVVVGQFWVGTFVTPQNEQAISAWINE